MKTAIEIIFVFLFAVLWSGCGQDQNRTTLKGDEKLFSLLPSVETGVDFSNDLQEDANNNINFYDYYYNGGGVAIGDVNNDGLADVFFTGNMVANQLYRNRGKLRFENVSSKAGIALTNRWSTGVTMADVNNDGYLDIYVCNSGPSEDPSVKANQLFINKGDGTFSEKAVDMGVADKGNSVQAVFFDYDKDGDLDLFVMNHSRLIPNTLKYHEWIETVSPQEMKRLSNSLYRNDSNGKFTDVSSEAGIQKPGFGLGLIASDLDKDGWTDIYVANDYFI